MDFDSPRSLLFDMLPIGAFRSTPSGQQVRANQALALINGYHTPDELVAAVNNLDHEWYVLPGRRQAFMALMERDGQVSDFVSQVFRYKTREPIWVRETAYAVRNAQGEVAYYEGTVEDITPTHMAAQRLAESEARWRVALEAAGDGVWDWHVQTGHEHCSDALVRMLGFQPGELPPHASALDARTHPDDQADLQRDRDAHFSGQAPTYRSEHRLQCKDGTWMWVLSRGMVVSRDEQGRPLRMLGTLTNTTAQKQAQQLIWQQAHFDGLTGLPNRHMLRQQLDQALAQAAQVGSGVAVVFIDLDQFKEVNDTLGHDMGDRLLVQAAARIRECVGPLDTVARMGGDEFTVVVAGQPPANADWAHTLQPLLAALLAALSRQFQLGQHQVFVSASVGVACYPEHAVLADDLLKHADQALYAAKGAGRNRHRFFTPDMQAATQWRARLDADLRTALPLQQFQVVYQPMVELATGQVFKAEALLRWHHPSLGAISPAQFIPVAEASGLIVPIGDWVFEQAAAQVTAWRERWDPRFQISVNQSPVQCHHHVSHHTSWAHRLQTMGLPVSCMAMEITEGLLLDTSQAMTEHLKALRGEGMDVSLDDFGTGYSSLSYLQKLDIDFLKIDQSFVRNLSAESTDLTLCKAIMAMANALGMRVVAEGVETAEQRDLLAQAGCHFGQGYLFAKPMPPEAFEAWMATRLGGTGTAAPAG